MRRLSNMCLVNSLKLSVTGDTAKYLVLTLYRGCTNLPTWPSLFFFHDAHFAQMDICRLGRDFSEVIPQTILYGPIPTYIPLHHLSRRIRVLTSYSIKPEPILACGCTVANEKGCLQSLCSWVAVHKCDTHDCHRDDSGVTTQHNPSNTNSTQVVH